VIGGPESVFRGPEIREPIPIPPTGSLIPECGPDPSATRFLSAELPIVARCGTPSSNLRCFFDGE